MSIRPAYRFNEFIGFTLWTTEPIGRAFTQYKHAVLAWEALK